VFSYLKKNNANFVAQAKAMAVRRKIRWKREAPPCPQPTGRGTAAPPCGKFMKQTSSDKTLNNTSWLDLMPNRKTKIELCFSIDKEISIQEDIEHKLL
jgi:hypothetical protein